LADDLNSLLNSSRSLSARELEEEKEEEKRRRRRRDM